MKDMNEKENKTSPTSTSVEPSVSSVEDFTMSFFYKTDGDKLMISCDRDLHNIDILLMLTQLLSMVEENYRESIIDLAKKSIEIKTAEKNKD